MTKTLDSELMDKVNSKDEELLEINLEDVSPPVPPDGGWAWMVLIGSVMCMFFVDGLSFSFGIILSDLQDSFETSKTKMSLAGSLIVGFTLISGPIVSAISNIFSFRTLVVTGGFLSSCSLFSCCFIYNIDAFIVMFGFVTGISFGLIYLPAATVVSQWFAKRRATATGISMCGSSIGTTLYSLIIPKLVEKYTWRGGLAIMSAMSLNCVIAGLMFIPLRDYQKLHPIKKKIEIAVLKSSSNEENGSSADRLNGFGSSKIGRKEISNSGSVAESGYLRHVCPDETDMFKTSKERGDRPNQCLLKPPAPMHGLDLIGDLIGEQKRNTPALPDSNERKADHFSSNKKIFTSNRGISLLESVTSFNSTDLGMGKVNEKPPPMIDLHTVNRVIGEVFSAKEQQHEASADGTGQKSTHYRRRRTVSARHRSPTPIDIQPTADAALYIKRDQHLGNVLFASAVSLRPHTDQLGSPIDENTKNEIVRQLQKEVDMPVHRVDFFYSGSMVHLDEFRTCSNMDDYMRTVTKTTEETAETGNYTIVMLKELFDFGLFKSPTFILLITSSVFGLIGYPVPYVFLKDNAQTLGYSAESASYLIVYMCAVNTVGRVGAGVISDWPCTDALFVNNAALIISGIACVMLPVLTSYAGHVCFAVTYGMAIAAFVSLRIILLVEMLGLDRLTNAFGFLLLFQGLAFMASPPILAGFYDLLQSFDYTFILAGGSLIFSAILCFPLRPILRWERQHNGDPLPLTHGGGCFSRLLRRLRDRFFAPRGSSSFPLSVNA